MLTFYENTFKVYIACVVEREVTGVPCIAGWFDAGVDGDNRHQYFLHRGQNKTT